MAEDIKSAEKSINDEIKLFADHLEALHETLPMTMFVLQEVDKVAHEKLKEFEEKHCKFDENDEGKFIKVPAEHYKKWKRKNSRVRKMVASRVLMPRSIFVSMISQYDAFLGRLLRAVFILKPEVMNDSQRSFTFQEISKYSSFEEFKSHVIEKEVETVLRKSHAEQFKYMEDKFGLHLTKDLKAWPKFIEITERRNLFVHNDGTVSKQYLSVCAEHKCQLDSECVEGSRLNVSQKYFMESYSCLYEIGFKLAHVLWRKLFPKEMDAADKCFNNSTFDLIERGEYELACILMDFARSAFKKPSNEYNLSILTVNCAQAHKWAGRDDKCKEIMSACDWSAKVDEFKMANAVLLDDWKESVALMKKLGANHDMIDKHAYKDWPLFKEFRKTEDFLTAYKEIFEEDFVVNVKKTEDIVDIENDASNVDDDDTDTDTVH